MRNQSPQKSAHIGYTHNDHTRDTIQRTMTDTPNPNQQNTYPLSNRIPLSNLRVTHTRIANGADEGRQFVSIQADLPNPHADGRPMPSVIHPLTEQGAKDLAAALMSFAAKVGAYNKRQARDAAALEELEQQLR